MQIKWGTSNQIIKILFKLDIIIIIIENKFKLIPLQNLLFQIRIFQKFKLIIFQI